MRSVRSLYEEACSRPDLTRLKRDQTRPEVEVEEELEVGL
jgi:hypothetical protein